MMKNNLQNFQVLYDTKFRQDISKDILVRHCKDIEIILTDQEDSDISGSQLFEEFVLLQDSFPLEFNKSPINLLEFLVKSDLYETFPNLLIVLRIILTFQLRLLRVREVFPS